MGGVPIMNLLHRRVISKMRTPSHMRPYLRRRRAVLLASGTSLVIFTLRPPSCTTM